MNRRGFLRLFGGGAVVATVAPTYFFAPVGGWTSDVLVNPTATGWDKYLTTQELLKIYYDKRFIENLKAQTPMMLAMGARPLPAASNRIVTFMPTGQHVDMSPRVQP